MASANGGQLAGLRNKIINGNMEIFQRGTAAVTANNGYGPADRWRTERQATAGDTFSTTQGSFVSGDALFDTGGAKYYTTVAVTSVVGAGNYVQLSQRIEDIRNLAGQTVTVSFWAKAASGTPLIGVNIDQFFGTGGSTTVDVAGQSQAITTTWTKYSKTFSVPSINGKTFGSNSSSTGINFWLNAGSTFNTESGSIGQASKTVSIAQVQAEISPVSTPFEFRPIQMELSLAQRYYYRIDPGSVNETFGPAFCTTTTQAFGTVAFPVTMQTAPSALDQSGVASDYKIFTTGGSSTNCSAVPIISASTTNSTGVVTFTFASGLVAGNGGLIGTGTTTGANAYLGFSAEL